MRALLLTVAGALGAYDEKEALDFAYMSAAAYCGYPHTSRTSLELWDCGPACSNVTGDVTDVRQIINDGKTDAYGYVARRGDRCVLAFRGTSNNLGWFADAASWRLVALDTRPGQPRCFAGDKKCRVGAGFYESYKSIVHYIEGNLSEIGCGPGHLPVDITGHSLGAAQAAIAQYDLTMAGYTMGRAMTFGAPRTGNWAFSAAFRALIQNGTSYRVTQAQDPIVHLPPMNAVGGGYCHVPTEISYSGTVAQGYQQGDGTGENLDLADEDWHWPRMLKACADNMHSCKHLHYMADEMKVEMDGLSCTNGTITGLLAGVLV